MKNFKLSFIDINHNDNYRYVDVRHNPPTRKILVEYFSYHQEKRLENSQKMKNFRKYKQLKIKD
jgi:hypothetical protein